MNTKHENSRESGMIKRLGRAVGGPASVLRAVAGVPAGVARTRRGTFMVVVIGTLALLAVIAIAHFAVSQTDRRTGASVKRAAAVDEVPQQVAKYIQDVITIDPFVNVPEEVSDMLTAAQSPRFIARREAEDRPSTDWRFDSGDNRLTIAVAGVDRPNRQYFTPEGMGTDPWLADIAPQWLNWAGDSPAGGAENEFQYRRDWGKISNFAPDGRFVNLATIRNNFAAESGFGVDASGKPRTSEGLTLLTWAPNNVGQRATVTNQTDFDLLVPVNSPARRRPAVWDSRQRGAYRPAKEWSSLLPSQNGYADNEWVDADGDGMLDARWQELVDARDLFSASGDSAMKNLLSTDGKLRWFFAARAIDLSGLVNVNTATDLRYEPGMAYPIGLTPADIDLKRLLTMSDSFERWGVGYDAILQPAGPANSPRASNYRDYDQGVAFDMGVGAYDSIRWSIKNVLVQDRYRNESWDWSGASYNNKQGGMRHAYWRQGASSSVGASLSANEVTLPAWFPPSDMGDLLGRFGVNNPEETSRLESATDGRIQTSGGIPPRRQVGFGPLRSNRDETVETNRTGRPNGAGNIVDSGGATPEAMLHAAVDLRSQVTTLSGARDIPSIVGNERVSYPYSRWATQILASDDGKVQLGSLASRRGTLDSDQAGRVFEGYVRALAPALKLPDVWPTGNAPLPDGGGVLFQSRKTLFYGHQGPELALTVAGSMAANLETMLNEDGVLRRPRTLVFDWELARRTIQNPPSSPSGAGGLPLVPWLASDRSYCLDKDADATDPILGQGATVQTPALHLYGFEPQAFITEVGCYTVWRDTPDNQDVSVVLPGQPPNRWITINGDMTTSNADYLFRCVAIQLHNPFDERVQVCSGFPAGGALNSAPEFQYVRIKNFDQDATWANIALFQAEFVAGNQLRLSGLTLEPGETVVCYAFNQNPGVIAGRLFNGGNGIVGSVDAGKQYIREWAEKQFTTNGANNSVSKRAIMVVRTNDAISDVVSDPQDTAQMIEDPSGLNGMTVQLWKARRADMTLYNIPSEIAGAGNPAAANRVENDQLMDRFRVAKGVTKSIDARIKRGDQEVEGCFGGPNRPPFGDAAQNHNGGAMIMRWATASRPRDPMDAGNDIPVGGLPAYCLEPKKWITNDWNTVNGEESGELPTTRMTVTKEIIDRLAENKGEAQIITGDWVSNSKNVAFSDTLPVSPRSKPVAKVPQIKQNLDNLEYRMLRDLMPRSARGDKGFGGAENPVFGTELPGSPSKGSTLRVADLLLPMAISPWESPLRRDLSEQTNQNIRYLTASEAFAVAYGYESIPAFYTDQTKADPLSLYAKTPDAQNPDGQIGDSQDRLVIDRGHIVLDDFAPFFDGNRDGFFSRDRAYNGLNPSIAISRDIRFGLGIPAALGILDQFSALEDHQGSAIRPVNGLININTAPPNVLRMLPLVTPADSAWGNDLIWANNWTQTSVDTDLAASIQAYRDKNLTWSERSTTPAKFDGDTAAGRTPIDANVGPATRSTERQLGRAKASQIDGIREETGFLSTGELMCVLERDADDRGGVGTRRDNPRSLDFVGYNDPTRSGGVTNDRKGVNSLLFRDGSGNLDVDGVKNDFAERVQILSALSNVTTVRSDYFAVWFVVRGYAQEDTENLGPDDPMSPSVERRFVMVIDRSGVSDLRSTNKPRVVLLKEVPR